MKEMHDLRMTQEEMLNLKKSRDFWRSAALAFLLVLGIAMLSLIDTRKHARSAAYSAESLSQRVIATNRGIDVCAERLRVATAALNRCMAGPIPSPSSLP